MPENPHDGSDPDDTRWRSPDAAGDGPPPAPEPPASIAPPAAEPPTGQAPAAEPPTGEAPAPEPPAYTPPPYPAGVPARRALQRTPVWPTPHTPASRTALGAVLGVAAVGAAGLSPYPGVGWVLTATALSAAVLVAGLSGGRPAGPRLGALVTGAAAVPVLMLPTMWRAAGWLDWLCVLAALGTATLAWSGAYTWRALGAGAGALFVTVPRAVPWLARGVRSAQGRWVPAPRTLLAGLVGVGLLIVFGGLFASADDTFAHVLSRALDLLSLPGTTRAAAAMLVAAALTGGSTLLTEHPPALHRLRLRRHGWLRPIEWALPVALLDLLFLAFVLVQVRVLVRGDDPVQRAGGPTYAGSARHGFATLVVVTVLTLLVVAVVVRKARRRAKVERRLLRILLGALCVLTLAVLASAVHRLVAYEDAYGFTRLRLLVHATELWLGVVLILVLCAGIRLRGRFLPPAAVLAAAVALSVLAWLNPDATIARHNVERFHRTGRVDSAYLSTLSVDAVPALDELPEPVRSCALGPIADRLGATVRGTPRWYRWIASRRRASVVLAHHPVVAAPAPGCAPER